MPRPHPQPSRPVCCLGGNTVIIITIIMQCSIAMQVLSNRVVQIKRSKEKLMNCAFLRPPQRKMENYRAVLHHSKQACVAIEPCYVTASMF